MADTPPPGIKMAGLKAHVPAGQFPQSSSEDFCDERRNSIPGRSMGSPINPHPSMRSPGNPHPSMRSPDNPHQSPRWVAHPRQLPVAIDTPLGRLDSEHRNHLVDRYFPQASYQVILLSTDTEIRHEEVERLREAEAISREYRLEYDPKQRQTAVVAGYFW